MASSLEFTQYVCGQLAGAGEITYRKLFGEYGIYCNQKLIGCVCDNQFFLKKTKAGRDLLREVVEAPIYEGAKPSYLIQELEDSDHLVALVQATAQELPEKKQKSKKKEDKYEGIDFD